MAKNKHKQKQAAEKKVKLVGYAHKDIVIYIGKNQHKHKSEYIPRYLLIKKYFLRCVSGAVNADDTDKNQDEC
jgi:hypothetical protein